MVTEIFENNIEVVAGEEGFLSKNEAGCLWKGDKHSFLLVMYEFCGNNALYLPNLLFTMFFSLLTPVDTRDCYYFDSVLSLVLLIKVLLIKKACNFVF